MKVKFGKTIKDVSILEVTPENYIVPKGEEGSYHCRIEQVNFNSSTGVRLSRPRIQKFGAKMWPSIERNLKLQGWKVDILYDPTDYLKAKAEEAAMTAEQLRNAKAEAEAQRRKAERDAIKAELLAELKAEGLLSAKEEKDKTSETDDAKKEKK